LFNHRVVIPVADQLRRQWLSEVYLVLETNGTRQLERKQGQIISLTIMGTLARSLQLHVKLSWKYSCPWW